MRAPLAVVVLAGGEGRRMGGAKPRMAWGQTSLIGHALDLAKSYGGDVAVAVRDEAQVVGALDERLLLDEACTEGPLAGTVKANK